LIRMPIPSSCNPLARFIEEQGFFLLDGGLATTLEAYGHDLNHELWSARVLLEEPEAIRRVHLDFLAAGADCIATASYQASLPGFRKLGLSADEGERLLRLSVDLAIEARDELWCNPAHRQGRLCPLVAASIGPYGAYLADGSEYRGDYDIDDDALYRFHESRWRILACSSADLLACETIPSRREARVLRALLRDSPDRWTWLSFSCRDGTHISDGNRLRDVASDCDDDPQIAAIGINCTPPEFIPSLIAEARKGTTKPILVYPNRGEEYDADRKVWVRSENDSDLPDLAAGWHRLGADGIGGCCRFAPADIARVRERFVG